MDNRAIAVFDSGLGGLTSLDKLMSLLPGENYIYFGDSGRMPYGDRDREEITAMSRQLTEFVLGFDVKAVLVACGTITSACLPVLQDMSPAPVFGVVEPAAVTAAAASKNGRIGVIATAATVRSGAYQERIAQLRPEAQVFAKGCPPLAPMVESGHFSADEPAVVETVRGCVAELLEKDIDTLLLGCTHYYLLEGALRRVCGDGVALVQNGGEAAATLAKYLTDNGLTNGMAYGGKREFFTSGDVKIFADGAKMFLGADISDKTRFIEPFSL